MAGSHILLSFYHSPCFVLSKMFAYVGAGEWELVGPDKYCDQTTEKDLGTATTVAQCQAMVMSDDMCGAYMYSHGSNCFCVLVGYNCHFEPTGQDNNVYHQALYE